MERSGLNGGHYRGRVLVEDSLVEDSLVEDS